MALFGSNTAGASTTNLTNQIIGLQATLPQNGVVTSISVALADNVFGPNATVRCGIYLASDLSLIAETNERTDIGVGSGWDSWFDFTFANNPLLQGGKDYILVVTSSSNIFVRNNTTSSLVGFQQGRTYGALPSTLSANPALFSTNYFSIYATYTPGDASIGIERVTVREVVNIVRYSATTLGISVWEEVSVSESVTLSGPIAISVFDNISVVDNLLEQRQLSVSTFIYGGTGSGSGENQQQIAQRFTATGDYITALQINLRKINSPTDNVIVGLHSSLTLGPLDSVSTPASGLSTSSAFIRFTFTNPVPVTNGSSYYIILSRDGARDTTNVALWGSTTSSTNAYNGTNDQRIRSNSVWSTITSNNDYAFVVEYGDNPSVSLTSAIATSDTITVTDVPTAAEYNDLSISVSDTITVTESIVQLLVSNISVVDGINVFDTVPNNVINPSFEVDTNQWGLDTTDYNRVTSDSYSGIASIKQISVGNFANFTTQNDATGLAVNRYSVYTFSFYGKISITSGFAPQVQINVGSCYGTTIAGGSLSGTGGNWQRFSYTFNVGNNDRVWFRIYNNNGTVTAFYDAFQLEPGSAASTYFDGSFGQGYKWNGLAHASTSSATANTVIVALSSGGNVAVADTVTVSESVTMLLDLNISVSDSVNVVDAPQVSKDTYFVSVSDTVTVTESFTTLVPFYLISVNDAVTVTESTTLVVSSSSTLAISVNDQITITESVTVRNTQLGGISVFDAISVSESAGAGFITSVSVFDAVSVAESVGITAQAAPGFGNLQIKAYFQGTLDYGFDVRADSADSDTTFIPRAD